MPRTRTALPEPIKSYFDAQNEHDIDGMLAAARVPVTLAAGEHDPMSPLEHLQPLVPDPLILKGLGHNAHVEDPAALRPLLERLAAGFAGSAG